MIFLEHEFHSRIYHADGVFFLNTNLANLTNGNIVNVSLQIFVLFEKFVFKQNRYTCSILSLAALHAEC